MTLADLIAEHRDLHAADLVIPRLVSRQPPTTLDPHTGVLYEEPAARTGMAMSARLLRRLGHPEGFGQVFPWSSALWRMKAWCRRSHPQHRSAERPYWRGSLCWMAVKLVVVGAEAGYIGPLSPSRAAGVLRIDRIEEVLAGAFRQIESEMNEAQARAEKREAMLEKHVRPVNEAPIPQESHEQGPFHKEDCGKCRKAAA